MMWLVGRWVLCAVMRVCCILALTVTHTTSYCHTTHPTSIVFIAVQQPAALRMLESGTAVLLFSHCHRHSHIVQPSATLQLLQQHLTLHTTSAVL